MLLQTQRFALGATHKASIKAVPVPGHALRACAPASLTAFSGGRPAGLAWPHPAGLTLVCRAIAEDAPASEQEQEAPVVTNQVFVGNLSWNTSSDALADHFSQAPGFLRAMVMMRDGRSRGMGLVEFETPDMATQAVTMLNESQLDGRSIMARPSVPRTAGSPGQDRPPRSYESRGERPAYGDRPMNGDRVRTPRPPSDPQCRLFVSNLAYATTWQTLKDHFSSIGPVEYATVKTGPDGRSRGFGFVNMASPEAASAAIDRLHESELDGRRVNVAQFTVREEI